MTRHAIVEHLDAHGQGALPRINAELMFSSLWEATVFALAVALSDAGSFDWREFHQHLSPKSSSGSTRRTQPKTGLLQAVAGRTGTRPMPGCPGACL
jgi:hypothetical protein